MIAVLFLGACVVLTVAVFVEFYKKDVRGYTAEDGTVKTKASKVEIILFAYLFSLLLAIPMYCIASFNLGRWLIFPYSLIIFAFQWILDEQFVKKCIKAIIEKATAK